MYKGENLDLENELTARREELGLKEMDATELKMRRNELGWTQQRIANNFGVARNTVARWENDKLKIPVWAELGLQALEMELVRARTNYHVDLMNRRHYQAQAKAADNGLDDSIYYNESALKERGWSDKLIRNLYGEQDFMSLESENRHARYYKKSKVKTIENTDAFKEHARKEHARKERAEKNPRATQNVNTTQSASESISVIQASSIQLDKSKYYNKSELKARGWTPAMIRDLYGEPDFLEPIQCGNMRPKYYYLISNIETIESTKAFTERARKPASDNVE
jgi:transcriptional regulator with XRE-family HTH domain